MDKEKQIEEMTKDFKLCSPCEMFAGYIDENGDMQGDKRCLADFDCTKCGISRDLARHLIRQNVRKITENEIVISKIKYEKLKQFEHRVRSGVCLTQKEWFDFCNEDSNRRTCLRIEEREKERKETAKEILKIITEEYDYIGNLERIIAKQFGVEIGE